MDIDKLSDKERKAYNAGYLRAKQDSTREWLMDMRPFTKKIDDLTKSSLKELIKQCKDWYDNAHTKWSKIHRENKMVNNTYEMQADGALTVLIEIKDMIQKANYLISKTEESKMETVYYLLKFSCDENEEPYFLSDNYATELTESAITELFKTENPDAYDIHVDINNKSINYRWDTINSRAIDDSIEFMEHTQVKVDDSMSLRDRFLALTNSSLMYHFICSDKYMDDIDRRDITFLLPEDCGFLYDSNSDDEDEEDHQFYITPLNYYKIDGIPDWFYAPKFLEDMDGWDDWDRPMESMISISKNTMTKDEAIQKLTSIGMKQLHED